MRAPDSRNRPGSRAAQIRRLNSLRLAQVAERAGARLLVVDDVDALHRHFAASIVARLQLARREGREVALILPWGPTGQYPILGRMLAKRSLSLRGCKLFFMDEYADEARRAVAPAHPLSFRSAAERWFETLDERLRPHARDVMFPNETNAVSIARRIDTCFGGVGIHGHVAFNEPETGVAETGVRLVRLNEFTRTINAIRAGVGGDLVNFPRSAWTLGMRECLRARRIELYCRSDHGLDWAKTVLRLALLGSPGDDYPVTWVRNHPVHMVVTTRATAERPAVSLGSDRAGTTKDDQ